MKYAATFFVVCIFIYLMSFACYNKRQKNITAAIGAAVIAAAALILPLYLLYFAAFEP